MPQSGLHGMVGMAVRKLAPRREWLFLGILLGGFIPDLDFFAVGVATVLKLPTENIHGTLTHSVFFALFIFLVFWIIGLATRNSHWTNLGIGLGIGILLHIIVDILLWFTTWQPLWPIKLSVNLWPGITPPDWLARLLQTAEFLFLGLFFIILDIFAREQKTDSEYLRTLRLWTYGLLGWFVLFSILAFVMQGTFANFYGLFYLVALGLGIGVTIRMRKTVEAI